MENINMDTIERLGSYKKSMLKHFAFTCYYTTNRVFLVKALSLPGRPGIR